MSRFKWDKIWTWVFPGSAGLLRRGLCDGENLTEPPFLSPHPVRPLFLMTMLENNTSGSSWASLSVPFSHLHTAGRQEGRGSCGASLFNFCERNRDRWCVPWPRTSPGISAGGAGVRMDHEDRLTLVPHPPALGSGVHCSRRCSVVWDCILTDGQLRTWGTWGLSPPGECCYVTG